ncbi:MAG: hypothetical protein M3Y89_12415, partial [Actinomycetota bacterium]|nr:hypothetical protein [Actinomycetota bacterium]
QNIANEVVLPVGTNGKIALYNGAPGTVDLLADITGYYLNGNPTTAGAFGPVTPTRLLDTRGHPITAGATTTVTVTGTAGVPTNGVSAVILNITALDATQAGYLIGWANGAPKAHTSIINFAAQENIANEVVLPVGTNGKIALYNGAPGTVDLLADITGYYLNGNAGSGIGNDVSWPQCGSTLPTGQAFGIVGINDGLANNTNPCFATQLSWAQNSAGGTAQAKAALYVNTGNPGLDSTSWPTSNDYPAGTPVSNPYGSCTGADSTACAYLYGYARAYDDVADRGVPTPTAFLWWLDVETTNSWEANKASNVADLEGMTRYLRGAGISVGVYASNYQWGLIAGTVSSTSNLSALPNWIPGASSLAQAQANCAGKALMTGSITLTQYETGGVDYDNSCH